MKGLSFSLIFWRLAIVAAIFVIADLASAPPVLGSGPTVAVTVFANGPGAPAGTVSALSSALYQSVDQSGKYSAVGGGPLTVQPALDGSIVGPAIDAASKAGAQEVVISELVSASGGSVVYRLSAYRVAPLMFIRTQIFSQSSLATPSLTAGFVTNLNTLHEPRSAIGTIYSLENGVHADLGSVYGFQLGQQFNVMRNGQKMAQAQINTIEDDSATVEITNPANGYNPQVGDQLIGLQPLPPLNPPLKSSSNTFTIWGLVVATGVALLAIGHHGNAAAANTGPVVSPSPIGGFDVTSAQTSGVRPTETFTFTFNQPVDTSTVDFTGTNQVYYNITGLGSNQPLTSLGGGTPTFDPTDMILTVNTNGSPTPGQQINFFFTSSILDTLGIALTPANFSFTSSAHHHPATHVHAPLPAPRHGGGSHNPNPN